VSPRRLSERDKKNAFFSKIESRGDALAVIRDASSGFYFIAGIQGLIGLFVAPSLLVDAAIYATLAFLLRKLNSRLVAVALLLVALAAVISTLVNKFGGGGGPGGSNIFLAAVAVAAGYRAVEATFALHSRFAMHHSPVVGESEIVEHKRPS
jgi:hypothetical protein